MKTPLLAGVFALATLAAHPVFAQDAINANDNEAAVAEPIRVTQQLLTPSAGLMNEHMHDGGELMIGLRFQRERYSGANRSGTDTISDAEILAAGFTTRPQAMEMDMLMLDLMYAPTDDLTLMVMPHYMWHRMEMVGIDPAHGGMAAGHGSMGPGHGGHAGGLPFGQVHAHGTEGLGDTLVSASYRLLDAAGLSAHATMGVWIPTGKVGRKNADGTFVHYGMQSGSGTWDVEPSLTVQGQAGPVGWGAQGAYRWRTEDDNESGFAFGDRFTASAWGSYLLTGTLGATARLEYEHEGQIVGHYNGPHNHAAPPDRQANYGGDVVSAGLGLNWLLPVAMVHRPQVGAEFAVPIHQDLNGIQLPRDWTLSLSLAQTF